MAAEFLTTKNSAWAWSPLVDLEGFGMRSLPMIRARAQLICTRPQNYMLARVQDAVAYLEKLGVTEDERRLTSKAAA
jgi:hypothetical protein